MYSSYLGCKALRLLDFGLDIKAEANAVAVAGAGVRVAAAAVRTAKGRGSFHIRVANQYGNGTPFSVLTRFSSLK